jgi:hypothetical protein
MEELMKFVTSLDRDRKVSDAGAFIEFLSPDPRSKVIDSGPQAIAWAATLP